METPDTLSERARGRLAALLGDGRPRRALTDEPDLSDDELDDAPAPDERPSGPAASGSQPRDAIAAVGIVERVQAGVTRRHVMVLAVLLAVACLGGGWAVLGARATPVPAVTASPVGDTSGGSAATSAPSSPAPASPTPAPEVTVHVAGAVVRPGLVRLPDGSRVADAIRAAGGLLPDADPAHLNLAEPLVDGSQVLIGTKEQPAGEVRPGSSNGGGSASGSGGSGSGGSTGSGKGDKLDLNRATTTQFEQLPGIGPVTAQRIVAWRDAHGRFSKVEELQEVDGIGPKTYAQLKDLVRV